MLFWSLLSLFSVVRTECLPRALMNSSYSAHGAVWEVHSAESTGGSGLNTVRQTQRAGLGVPSSSPKSSWGPLSWPPDYLQEAPPGPSQLAIIPTVVHSHMSSGWNAQTSADKREVLLYTRVVALLCPDFIFLVFFTTCKKHMCIWWRLPWHLCVWAQRTCSILHNY